jgi:hypothetical protein
VCTSAPADEKCTIFVDTQVVAPAGTAPVIPTVPVKALTVEPPLDEGDPPQPAASRRAEMLLAIRMTFDIFSLLAYQSGR